MSRANVRGLGISGPTSPLHNGQSVPSNSPYSPVPTVSGSATRLDVLDHGLAYDPSESYEDVVGFSMDDGTTPAPTFVGLSNVHLSREDRQEGYDTTLLELHPRGENRGSLVENLDSPPHSPPLSPSPSGDPFASPPSPLFSGGGSSMRSVGTGSPRPKSQEPMFSISDSTRFAAMGYENRARDAARASKTASKRVSHTPAGLSEKPGQEERVQKWRKVRTLAIIAIVVVIIALAVGLGAGLGTKKSNSNKAASATSSASSSSSISPASELTPSVSATLDPITSDTTPEMTTSDLATATTSYSAWAPTVTTDWATYTGDETWDGATATTDANNAVQSTDSWDDGTQTTTTDWNNGGNGRLRRDRAKRGGRYQHFDD